ncbi:uncharacterized protein LOC113407734, partial [Terrapene carolina triunguis]|uniref:uncharacterized protein LOC113407734 n=1 Tax=Terrapene triunguis TaxID=2587831 RepID=UPI000E774BB2
MALALRLLLLGAAALQGGHSRLHSRRVLDTVVSEPSPGLPWYSRVVYVDDQVIYVYTSGMQKAEPRTAWMAQNEGPEFWDERTWWAQRHQKWFKASLNTLGQLYNQSEGSVESSTRPAASTRGAVRHQQGCGTIHPGGVCCGQGLAGMFATTVAGCTTVGVSSAGAPTQWCLREGFLCYTKQQLILTTILSQVQTLRTWSDRIRPAAPQRLKLCIVSLASIIPSLDPGDGYAALDLKDAYFHISIFRGHRRFLRIIVNQAHYQFTILPFSLSAAKWVFMKCMVIAAAYLR